MNEKDINAMPSPDESVENIEAPIEEIAEDTDTAADAEYEAAEVTDQSVEGDVISAEGDAPSSEDETENAEEAEESKETDETAEDGEVEETEEAEETVADTAEESTEEAESEENPEDDIAYVAERITGARHSNVSTAAPIRTRTPEQNRNIGNGIPMRERKAENANAPAPASSSPKFITPFTVTVATALIAVILMITAVLIINNMYIESGEKSRPADFDMADTIDPDTIMDIESKPGRPIQSIESESDSTSESDNASDAPVEDPALGKYKVTLDFFEGEDITVSTERITFGELIESLGYTLKNTDRPSVANDYVIAADAVITIDKVQYVNVTVTEDIPFESEKIETDLIMRGTTNYITEGENGMKETTYAVEYVNGVEASRTYVSERIAKEPVNEVYEYGVGGSFVGADGITYTYSMRRVVPATYYNIEGPTYIGKDADETVIAVDPNYIPLYTVLYVKNDKYDFGVRVAADTGSLVKGWEVDIWIADDNPQLKDFAWIGYHYDMEIYYIDQ